MITNFSASVKQPHMDDLDVLLVVLGSVSVAGRITTLVGALGSVVCGCTMVTLLMMGFGIPAFGLKTWSVVEGLIANG
jgi:hypothetical protein